MMEISERTGCRYKEIVDLMKDYNIPRRNWSEATYVKRNPEGDPFKVKSRLNEKETELKGVGLGIYWARETKVQTTRLFEFLTQTLF